MRSYRFVLLLPIFLTWGCAPIPDPNTSGKALAEQAALAGEQSLTFAQTLDRHLARPADERTRARRQALAIAEFWRDFEREAHEVEDSELRQWYYQDNEISRSHRGFGLGNSILELRKAVEADPSFGEGWGALGRLCAEAGDLLTARTYLDCARLAALAASAAGQPLDRDLELQIYRERAWVLRDLALWEEGLAAVGEGLRFSPGDPDLVLVKGLLLAGAGRYEEAVALAVRMDPVEYPQYDFIHRGFKMQRSSHANNWIRAMALLAIGELDWAYAKIGDLPTYAYRARIAHSPRFWRDAALLAELHGDSQAPIYYAVGFVTRHYQYFYPAAANNVAPLVLELPDAQMPVYTSFGRRFYVGGSPFSFVGLQMNQLSDGLFAGQRSEAAGRALQMLELLERHRIKPEVCRAFRGRIFYAHDQYGPAEIELRAARDGFRAQGRTDPGTSLLLGLLKIRVEDYARAESYLEESLAADPENAIGWRSLGVAYSRRGQLELAGQAMTRAVQLDPWNVSGLYNRGLFHFQNRQPGPALADLDRALRIDPENREVQRLRAMAASAIAQADPGMTGTGIAAMSISAGPPAEFTGDPAQLLAELQADVDGFFAVPDSLKSSGPQAEQRIQTLMAKYLEYRDPALRAVLAMALIDHGRLQEVQSLLAPGWGVDLIPAEELMLLYADSRIGERRRAEQVMQQVLSAGDGSGNPYAVALAARTMRTSTDPVGTDPRNSADHGFFGWWRTAKSNAGVNAMSRPRFARDLHLFRKYANDPTFEGAVWGMAPTPIEGGQTGAGSQTAGK